MQDSTINMHYDADLGLIQARTVAVIGYGSQGHAHAQNLRDSGVNVVVGLRSGSSSCPVAERHDLRTASIAAAAAEGDVVMILIPDQHQKRVYESEIRDVLAPGKALAFGHGFNIHYEQITPPAGVDCFMVAPKSPGHLVRRTYEKGRGVPCLAAVAQDATGSAMELALSYAKAIGGTRAGVIETTFADETETDLFGEQAVLCGGSEALIKAGFETMVEAGYPPELAYFEVLHELKLIVDLYYEGGLEAMNTSVSDTAEYGGYSRGSRVVTDAVKREMEKILAEVRSGQFAREWIQECEAGWPNMTQLREAHMTHPIETVGRELRGMMSWLRETAPDTKDRADAPAESGASDGASDGAKVHGDAV